MISYVYIVYLLEDSHLSGVMGSMLTSSLGQTYDYGIAVSWHEELFWSHLPKGKWNKIFNFPSKFLLTLTQSCKPYHRISWGISYIEYKTFYPFRRLPTEILQTIVILFVSLSPSLTHYLHLYLIYVWCWNSCASSTLSISDTSCKYNFISLGNTEFRQNKP